MAKSKKIKFVPPVLTQAEALTQQQMVERFPLGGFDEGDPRTFFIGPDVTSIYNLPFTASYSLKLGDEEISSYSVLPAEAIVDLREYDRGFGMCKLEEYATAFKIPGFEFDWEWQRKGFYVATLFTVKDSK